MRFEVQIGRKQVYAFLISLVVLTSFSFVLSYNTNFNAPATSAQVVGHSADETVVKMNDGSLKTVQELLQNGIGSSGGNVIQLKGNPLWLSDPILAYSYSTQCSGTMSVCRTGWSTVHNVALGAHPNSIAIVRLYVDIFGAAYLRSSGSTTDPGASTLAASASYSPSGNSGSDTTLIWLNSSGDFETYYTTVSFSGSQQYKLYVLGFIDALNAPSPSRNTSLSNEWKVYDISTPAEKVELQTGCNGGICGSGELTPVKFCVDRGYVFGESLSNSNDHVNIMSWNGEQWHTASAVMMYRVACYR